MTGPWPDDPAGVPDRRPQATRRVDPSASPGARTGSGASGAIGPGRTAATTTRASGLRIGRVRLTAARVMLVVAVVGSVGFVLYALAVRDASQIPLLAAGALVLGIVFSVLAVMGLMGTYAAACDGRSGAALGQAVAGGVAALVGFGCFALAALLVLLLRSPAGG